MITMFLTMIFFHFLADYPLQGDFLSKAKNHKNPIPGVPWYQALGAHCAIHAGFVFIATGSYGAGLSEFIIHWYIDYRKNEGKYTFNEDQFAHLITKIGILTAMVLTIHVGANQNDTANSGINDDSSSDCWGISWVHHDLTRHATF